MIPECPPEWFELLHRVFSDNLPAQVELAFLHGQTRDNESSVLIRGADLYHKDFAQSLGITFADASLYSKMMERYEAALKETNPALLKRIKGTFAPKPDGSLSGYPGYDHWQQALIKEEVAPNKIEGVRPSYEVWFSTDAEAAGLVRHCKERGIREVSVTTAPFHQARAFISGVSAILREGATGIKLYSVPGLPLPWGEVASHSQGTTQGSRRNLLVGEHKRILDYHELGNPRLASLSDVLGYLNDRDRR